MNIGDIKQVKCPSANLNNSFDNGGIETQILFGETVTILNLKTDKVYCRSNFDNYKGWLSKSELGTYFKETHIIVKPSMLGFRKT